MARIAVDQRAVHRNQGGIGRYAGRLASALVQGSTAHDWHLLYGSSVPDSLDALPATAHRHTFDARQIDPQWEQLQLPTILARMGIDLYHATCFAVPVARGQTATIATVHDVVFRSHPHFVNDRLRDYLDRWTAVALDLADAVVTVSEFSRSQIVAHYGADPERVHVIHNGVHATQPSVADLERVRLAHSLPERFVLYLGAIEPKKNVVVLLDAQARLRGRDAGPPPVPLVIAGGQGAAHLDLEAQIRRRGLDDWVRPLGYVPDADVLPLMAAASVFAYPSRHEGFGLPVLEAMAVGTPVVAADSTSLPEVGGEAASYAGVDDPDAWAAQIARLLENDVLAERQRQAGLARAADFSWTRCAAAHLALYEQVLATR